MISAGSGKGRTQRRTSSFFNDASPMMIDDERADREAGRGNCGTQHIYE